MIARRILPIAALVLLTACQYPPAQPTAYGPSEEGLTLAFEDPSLPQPQRSQQRLQIRVAKTRLQEDGSGLVAADYTSQQGSLRLLLQHQHGGINLVTPDGKTMAVLLPAGFPQTLAWQDRGITFRVLGRGTWDGARILPDTRSPVGVWVEASTEAGPIRRTLYLPGLGEVESLERNGSAWIPTNRLVALGFTDLPISNSRP